MDDNQHFQYINKLGIPILRKFTESELCLKVYCKEHWTWNTNVAAMNLKLNFECVIQYYNRSMIYPQGINENDLEWA